MAKSTGKTPAERHRAGDIDLTELNAAAADEARAACMPDAVNPPGTESGGLTSVTTADTP